MVFTGTFQYPSNIRVKYKKKRKNKFWGIFLFQLGEELAIE